MRIQSNNVSSNTAVPVVITGSTLARVSSSGNDWTYLGPGSINDISGKIFASIYCSFGCFGVSTWEWHNHNYVVKQ